MDVGDKLQVLFFRWYLPYLIFIYLFICEYVCMREHLLGFSLLLPPCGIWGAGSGCKTWWQETLPTEAS